MSIVDAPAVSPATELTAEDDTRDGTDPVAVAAYRKMLERVPVPKAQREGTILRLPLAV